MKSNFNFFIIIILLMMPLLVPAQETALENAMVLAATETAQKLVKVDELKRIAIVRFAGDVGDDFTDRLMTAIVRSRKYKIIDRRQLALLLGEANMQMTEIIDPKTAVRAGKIAGVDALIYGKLKRKIDGKNRGEIAYHLQMVNVQTGEIVGSQNISKSTPPPRTDLFIPVIILFGIAMGILLIFLFFRRRRRSVRIISSSGFAASGKSEPIAGYHQNVNDVEDLISVEQSYAVPCRIELNHRKATIDRFVVKLKGSKAIPAGWRGSTALVQGIDRRVTLNDSIAMAEMRPGKTPINSGTATIPRDIAASHDSWALEFHLIDPLGGELLLFKSPSVSFI